MEEGTRRLKLNGKTYICQDIGCPDFGGARQNRERVAQGFALSYWKRLEDALQKGGELPEEFKNIEE